MIYMRKTCINNIMICVLILLLDVKMRIVLWAVFFHCYDPMIRNSDQLKALASSIDFSMEWILVVFLDLPRKKLWLCGLSSKISYFVRWAFAVTHIHAVQIKKQRKWNWRRDLHKTKQNGMRQKSYVWRKKKLQCGRAKDSNNATTV